MLTLSQIGTVLTALISLIPLVVSAVREGQIRASSQEDLTREVLSRINAKFDVVDAAKNDPTDYDPYNPDWRVK